MFRGLMLTMCVVCAAVGCDNTQRPAGPNAANNPNPATTPRDNTGVNERDRADATKTPIDQNENKRDIDVTANIRERVVATKLSVNAQNVKIITQEGKVTLRGPVKTGEEKQQIEQIATDVAGAGNVDSQLEVQP